MKVDRKSKMMKVRHFRDAAAFGKREIEWKKEAITHKHV